MNRKMYLFFLSILIALTVSSCHTPSWISYDPDDNTPVTQAFPDLTADPDTDKFSLIPEVPSNEGKNSPYGLVGDKVYNQFPLERPATGKKVIIVDPNIPAWAAYDANGKLVKMGAASAGRDYCADTKHACRTVTGTFSVYSKKGADCKSSIFPLRTHGGAPMPYCMHFYRGYALHGSYEMEDYDASHGCVRMYPSSAKWLSQNFVEIGTTVIVEPYKNPLALPKGVSEPAVTKKTAAAPAVTETSTPTTPIETPEPVADTKTTSTESSTTWVESDNSDATTTSD